MQADDSSSKQVSIGIAATLACLYEATARKPGNVYPDADFDETTTYAAFVKSAVVIGPIIEKSPGRGVGQTVLDSVQATREAVGTNTNLGTVLLIAPLAAVPSDTKLECGIGAVLDALTPDDTRTVYEAIRLANAGGLGREDVADIRDIPPPDLTLKEAMRLAAKRDLVAKQYASDFEDVFRMSDWIENELSREKALEKAIIHTFVLQIATCPDSLIERKCGPAVAKEASVRAGRVLEARAAGETEYHQALDEFDGWLRADGHRRNPGTTADLIAAALFVLLLEGQLDWKSW